MKNKIVVGVLTILLCLTSVWCTRYVDYKYYESNLKQLAQSKLSSSIENFNTCRLKEDDFAYWSAVTSFREYIDITFFLQEEDAQSVALYSGIYNEGCAVYAILIDQPEKVRSRLEEVVTCFEQLEEEPSAEIVRMQITNLRSSLDDLMEVEKDD